MSRRKAADAASDDDQIIDLAGVDGLAGRFPKGTVAQLCAASNEPGWLPRMPVFEGGS
jgi:hypothetical protein